MLLGDRGEGTGYVGVSPSHPYYDVDTDLLKLKAHGGGVTFAGEVLRTDEENPLTRLFTVYGGDSLYVFGFDCSHANDFVPGLPMPGTEVRDDDFVRQECRFLAEQLAVAANLRR